MKKKTVRLNGTKKPKKKFKYPKTDIEWADFTVNLWWGCMKVSLGCEHCYAEKDAKFYYRIPIWGKGTSRRKIEEAFIKLDDLQKEAASKRVTYRVFIGSMMDIFELPQKLIDKNGNKIEDITTAHLRYELFKNISDHKYDNLVFMFLTKRPSNINKMIPDAWKIDPPANVFFGTSPVDKGTAFKFIEQLLTVKGNKFLSVEPLLEEISLKPWLKDNLINFVIVGGESGGDREERFNPDWGRIIRDECLETNTPFFFKQVDRVRAIPKDLQIRHRPIEVYGCAATACKAINDESYIAMNAKATKAPKTTK